jgi:hypothetical protein
MNFLIAMTKEEWKPVAVAEWSKAVVRGLPGVRE